MAGVRIREVWKSFGSVQALNGLSVDIRDGEFLTLVGPSGCGKTTLLRILAGLDNADSGDLSIGDRSVSDVPPKHRNVAMVFQSYALYPYMTVRHNIAVPLLMRSLTRMQRLPVVGRWMPGAKAVLQEIDQAVLETAATLGLTSLLDRKPSQLSGGQRQRVALGRAMVRQPSVFLMDEPLSNLDAKLRVSMRAEIALLHRRLGTTFIYVTHDQVEAMTMSDRVAMMMDGRILQLAEPQEIYDDPVDLRVAEFIGTPKANTLAATVIHGEAIVSGIKWPLTNLANRGPELNVVVRPEWWVLTDSRVNSIANAGLIEGVVNHVELLGSETLLHVRCERTQAIVVAKLSPESARGLRPGEPMKLRSHRALIFDGSGDRLRDIRWDSGRHCDEATCKP